MHACGTWGDGHPDRVDLSTERDNDRERKSVARVGMPLKPYQVSE